MAVTVAEFKLEFPEFGDLADASITPVLNRAARQVDDEWGNDKDIGQMLYAAHILSIRESSGAGTSLVGGRQVIHQAVGDGSITYQNQGAQSLTSVPDETFLKQTTYGQEYARLAQQNKKTWMLIS